MLLVSQALTDFKGSGRSEMVPWVKQAASGRAGSRSGTGLGPLPFQRDSFSWPGMDLSGLSLIKQGLLVMLLRCPGPSCATSRADFVFPNNLVKVIDILTGSRWSCLSLFKSWGLQGLERSSLQMYAAKNSVFLNWEGKSVFGLRVSSTALVSETDQMVRGRSWGLE